MNFFNSTTLFGLLLLPVAALVSGLTQQALSPKTVSADPGASLRSEIQAAGFAHIDLPGLRDLLVDGTHLLIDARDAKAYAAGHLPGAQSLPLRDFETHFPDLLPVIASGMPLLIYCSGPTCDDALQLALRLRETGFDNTTLYLGGWEEWSGP